MQIDWIAPLLAPRSLSAGRSPAFALSEWIEPMYLRDDTIEQVHEAFVEQGSLQLSRIFRRAKWAAVQQALGDAAAQREQPDQLVLPHTRLCGPAHKQRYFRLAATDDDDGPAALVQLRQFVASEQFFDFVRRIHGPDGLAPRLQHPPELRIFTPGCYTLMHDQDDSLTGGSVDVLFSLSGGDDWDDEHGGFVAYLADKEELVSISPQSNCLALVKRPAGTMRFVKFLTHQAEQNRIDLFASFQS